MFSNSSPDVSLVLLNAQINTAEDLNMLSELEWMERMCDQAGSDEDTDTEEEFALDNDAILVNLIISDLHKLDSSNSVLSPLTPLSTPPSSPVLSVVPPSPPAALRPSRHHSNSPGVQDLDTEVINSKHTITMQNILSAEDDLLKALHIALSLYCDEGKQTLLACHMSPSIQEQLFSNHNPPPLTLPPALAINTKALSLTKHPQCPLAKFEL
ncbi:hypothetical protein V8B97DRAFT_2012106 [Scleroderma yunnanense]